MKKSALILLPGLLCDHRVWSHQVEHLSDIADIIIPDLSKPETPAGMVEEILNVAPPTFSLAGHSMGGWLALELMRVASERVERLCLLSTSAEDDSPERRALREEMIVRVERGEVESIIDEAVDLFTFKKEVCGAVKEMFLEDRHAFIPQQKSMLARKSLMPVLDTIRCPTMMIHARHDARFTLENAEVIVDNIDGAKLAIIEESGHMVTMEQPQAATALMRLWLSY